MGGENWVRFETGQSRKARTFLAPLGEGLLVQVDNPIRLFDCWFEWSKGRLAVSYGADRIISLITCREIARRFPITRFGNDTLGFFKVIKKTGYMPWPEWVCTFNVNRCDEYRYGSHAARETIEQVETQVVELFRGLDQGKLPDPRQD